MQLDAFKVDAFTTKPYTGNPAGVILDANGLSERQMQAIAREMNLSETAFLLKSDAPGADLRLRYFTPSSEIKLCGHATVATFHVLAERKMLSKPKLRLQTNVGVLDIEVRDGEVLMQSDPLVVEPSPLAPTEVARLLGSASVSDVWLVKRILFATVPGLKALEGVRADLPAIARLYKEQDIDGLVPVSFETQDKANLTHIRYFVPGVGIDEDPVTGVAHMALAGYAQRVGRAKAPGSFTGEQGAFVGRAGVVRVEMDAAGGVRIGGRAVTVLEGKMRAP